MLAIRKVKFGEADSDLVGLHSVGTNGEVLGKHGAVG